MKALHLTDNEIQEFVLGEINKIAIIDHVAQCKHCSLKVMQYKLMFEAIKGQVKPVFDFDVTQLVMKELRSPQATMSKDKYVTYLISIGVFSVFGLLIYALSFYARNITASLMPVSLYLIITAALFISGSFVADMYKTFKTKMNALDYC